MANLATSGSQIICGYQVFFGNYKITPLLRFEPGTSRSESVHHTVTLIRLESNTFYILLYCKKFPHF